MMISVKLKVKTRVLEFPSLVPFPRVKLSIKTKVLDKQFKTTNRGCVKLYVKTKVLDKNQKSNALFGMCKTICKNKSSRHHLLMQEAFRVKLYVKTKVLDFIGVVKSVSV